MQIRTTAVALLMVTVILAASAIALVTVLGRGLRDQADQRLREMALVGQRADEKGIVIPQETINEVLVQVVDDRGRLLFASPRLESERALWAPTDETPPNRPVTVTSPGLGRLRVMGVPYRDNWLVTVGSLESSDDSIGTLRTVLIAGLPVVAIGLGIVFWFVVGRTLRPVAQAREREERLLADVSHELRNPLAGVRALLESEPIGGAEIAANRALALDTLARLEGVASGLLILAKNGQPPGTLPLRPVDVDDLVFRLVGRRAGVDRQIAIDVADVRSGQVLGSEADLESMVDNLLSNACRHARSRVRVGVSEAHGQVRLVVGDDGPGIPDDERERVFDRFTRLDESRARDRGGAGLGLSIVRAVASAHDGAVVVGTSSLGGAELVVTLPASTGAAPDPIAPIAFSRPDVR